MLIVLLALLLIAVIIWVYDKRIEKLGKEITTTEEKARQVISYLDIDI